MNQSSTLWIRLIPAALLMGGTLLYVRGRKVAEQLPPRKSLTSFPDQIASGEERGRISQRMSWM